MIPILDSYFDRLEEMLEAIKQGIDGLPVEALDWSPGAGMNSLGVLAVHVAGSTRYWIGDVAGEEPSGRVRDVEFESRAMDAGALQARLDATLAHSRSVLARLTHDDLVAVRGTFRDGKPYTGAWALWHALEHAAQHVGHVQITRQLWDMRGE